MRSLKRNITRALSTGRDLGEDVYPSYNLCAGSTTPARDLIPELTVVEPRPINTPLTAGGVVALHRTRRDRSMFVLPVRVTSRLRAARGHTHPSAATAGSCANICPGTTIPSVRRVLQTVCSDFGNRDYDLGYALLKQTPNLIG